MLSVYIHVWLYTAGPRTPKTPTDRLYRRTVIFLLAHIQSITTLHEYTAGKDSLSLSLLTHIHTLSVCRPVFSVAASQQTTFRHVSTGRLVVVSVVRSIDRAIVMTDGQTVGIGRRHTDRPTAEERWPPGAGGNNRHIA
jgi:hypothetical protein